MRFRFAVEIEVKNDALTQEAGRDDVAVMLLDNLEDNKLSALPWVLIEHYTVEDVAG